MALNGTDAIRVPPSAKLIFKHPLLDPLYIHSGATAIQWDYHLNTQSTPTLGGEVVQVLSAVVGPITIKGQTAGLKTNASGLLDLKTETRGWKDQGARKVFTPNDELREIMEWFRQYMVSAGTNARGNVHRDERAIEFIYPERGWDFWIQPIKLDGFRYDRQVIAPEWSITAEIVNDNALDYFAGVTMSSFTDDLITNQALIGKIGLSAFAESKTETANTAFGQTGASGSNNPFLNPELSISADVAAKKMGDNFQALVSAWATGDFAHFGFGALLDNGALPKDVDAAYQQLFGSSFLGSLPGNNGPTVRGSTSYNGPTNPQTQDQIILDIATSFEQYGIPGKLGVAVAINESNLNPDQTQVGCNGPSCGIGLFQVNGDGSGRDSRAMVKLAGQNRVYSSSQGNITPYYPAGAQIAAAAQWFSQFAKSDFPGVDFTSADDTKLASLADLAQTGGVGDPAYQSKIIGLLPKAQKLIDNASASAGTGGPVPTGSAQNLAKLLLSYYGTTWFDDDGRGKEQIETVANGEQITNINGQKVNLDPRTMQTVLALIARGYKIGTSSWCKDHSDDGPNGHAGGKCVDISSINGVAINVDTQQCHDLTLTVAKILRNLQTPAPRQLICGGFGDHRSADISSQCIPGADQFYGAATMQQHTNHIHVGF